MDRTESNSITYRAPIVNDGADPEPQKCPYCNGYHLGGCHLAPTKRLTPCELRILQLSAEGYSCSDAAMMLGVVTDTVKHHRANLINKLGAENIANAVYIGLKTAIIV